MLFNFFGNNLTQIFLFDKYHVYLYVTNNTEDMNEVYKPIALFFAAAFVAVILAIILAWTTQLLWNGCLVPAIDGINEITLLQALGLNFLFSILFKDSNTSKSDD